MSLVRQTKSEDDTQLVFQVVNTCPRGSGGDGVHLVGQRGRRTLPTSGASRLPLLVLVALVEVVQVADVGGLEAHQAGQTLHVLVTEGHKGAL